MLLQCWPAYVCLKLGCALFAGPQQLRRSGEGLVLRGVQLQLWKWRRQWHWALHTDCKSCCLWLAVARKRACGTSHALVACLLAPCLHWPCAGALHWPCIAACSQHITRTPGAANADWYRPLCWCPAGVEGHDIPGMWLLGMRRLPSVCLQLLTTCQRGWTVQR